MSAADTAAAIREDMIRIANMRADLEQIADRRFNCDLVCRFALRAADDALLHLARRLSALSAAAQEATP